MTPAGWETLAIQVPVVVVFTGAMFFIMREQFRNMQVITTQFITFIANRDKDFKDSIDRVAHCLEELDKHATAQEQFVRERFKELME